VPAAPRGLDPSNLFYHVPAGAPVALAISGGSDSMALLRLAAAWRKSGIAVLTVDHGLRAESVVEAKRVAAWCAALGLSHVTLAWQGPKPATGLQAKARSARYDLMTTWCRTNGAETLLTAHTMDDQAETVLMRLARTTSFDSLAGIYATSHWKGLRLFRPLLRLRREALRRYLRDLGQEWIDDPSNSDERFERVRIRRALPVLEGLGITVEGLSKLADTAREVSNGLWGATDDWVKQHVRVFDTGYCTVPLTPYIDQAEALKTRILGWLIARLGAGTMPEPAELELLVAWVDVGGSRRTLGGALIGRRKDHLIIGREPGRIGGEALVVPESGEGLWDHRFEIRSAPGSRVRALGTGALPRVKSLPAFVQNALPAVEMPDGSLCVPHLGVGEGATARFHAGLAG
jgi:tRNA(Ile)-lysidine synthase